MLADAGYAVSVIVPGMASLPVLFDVDWVLFPVLLGAAAIHPSMAVLSETVARDRGAPGPGPG